MNDFNYYGKFRYLEKISEQYTSGRQYSATLYAKAMEIAERTYRVAFIGEFKRGKSSLINALLGSDVLPMDIVPTTAAITRIVNGEEKKIKIYFRDNTVEEKPLEELCDFVTKKDSEHEKMASSIKEVVVSYPSVICSNRIEIIDTPGLNDNDQMSRYTMEILGKIDAAVIVISAEMPVSETEQQLILDVIKEPGIQHIIFAITFIDTIQSEKGKKLIIEFIYNRISQMVRQLAKKKYRANSDLLNKIERILSTPDVYGVSALQARTAFQKDDKGLLEESRLVYFKEELMNLLKKGQNESVLAKTLYTIDWLLKELPAWKSNEEKILRDKLQQSQDNVEEFKNSAKEKLITWFQQMDIELNNQGISAFSGLDSSWETLLRQCFIKRLSMISVDNNQHQIILKFMEEAREDAKSSALVGGNKLHNWIIESMEKVEGYLSSLREKYGIKSKNFEMNIANYHKTNKFPTFIWVEEPIPSHNDLRGIDLMPIVNNAINVSLSDFSRKVDKYISSWRIFMLSLIQEDIKNCNYATLKADTEEVKKKLDALPFIYGQHMETLRKMSDELKRK